MNKSKALFSSAIVLYFIIALEFLIMISPFAGLFYSVFNPLLVAAGSHPATRWLSAFFLPHMVVPPNALLQFIRVMGSVLFVLGMGWFLFATGRAARYDTPEGKLRAAVSTSERAHRNFWETSRWLLLGTAVIGAVLIVLPGRSPDSA